jgi:hypothetical protein
VVLELFNSADGVWSNRLRLGSSRVRRLRKKLVSQLVTWTRLGSGGLA